MSNPEANVISVSFEDDSKAFDALTQLKELDSQGQISLQGAAVVTRYEDGSVHAKDEIDDTELPSTAAGGLIGLLVGIIGGPLGILIGGATGLLVGSLFDLHDADDTDSVLSEMSKSVRVGRMQLLAEVVEPSADVVDVAMKRLGGSVLRRPVVQVEAEIAAAEKAERHAKREARQELAKARLEKHKEANHAKVEALKGKLRHPHGAKQTAGTASSSSS